MSEKELEQNIEKIECNEEELVQVSGGKVYLKGKDDKDYYDYTKCACVLGGAGNPD